MFFTKRVLLEKQSKDVGKGLKLLEDASNYGSVDAKYELAKLYLDDTFEKKDSTLLPYIYYHYAETYLNLSDTKKETDVLLKILKLVNWDSNNYLVSRVHSFLAVTNQLRGDYEKALIYHLNIIKKSQFEELKAWANMNIAGIYIETKRYSIAKPFIDNVFHFYKNNKKEGLNHESLAFMYIYSSYHTDNFNDKLELINKGIKLTQTRGVVNRVSALLFRAKFYMQSGKNDLAITDLTYALQLTNENKVFEKVPDIHHLLATIALENNNYDLVHTQLDSARFYLENDDKLLKKENTSLRYQAYFKAKKYKEAFKYAQEYIQLQDSITNNKTDSLYISYGKKYQTEKKIQENELLKKDNLIKDLEVIKQTTNRNYLLLLSALGLILLGVTYNRFRLKRKTANALATQNTIINNQKLALEKSNANKQRLFGIIAHDLVNPFNAILGYTQLLEEDYDNFNDKERKNFITTINKYANSNYKLTRTLLDWAKVQQEKLVVNKATLSCKEIVAMAIQPYQVLADKKNIHIQTHISDTIFVEADKNMMQTVIGNLFVNAIKFTPENGEIKFHLDKNKDGTVTIEIEDSGIGMNQEQLNNLFDITKVNTRQGTNNEKGNGLGLILCKELMELQKGTLQMFSQLNKGSRAVVTI